MKRGNEFTQKKGRSQSDRKREQKLSESKRTGNKQTEKKETGKRQNGFFAGNRKGAALAGGRAGAAGTEKQEPESRGLSVEEYRSLGTEVRVSVETEEQLAEVLKWDPVALVYLDEAGFTDQQLLDYVAAVHRWGKRAGLRLRRIQRENTPGLSSQELLRKLSGTTETLPDAILLRNMDQVVLLDFLSENVRHPEIVFDYTVYGYNEAAREVLRRLGGERLTFPVELTLREIGTPESRGEGEQALPREMLVYGHLPMMVSANCVIRTRSGCDHRNRCTMLKDRMGKEMPVRAYCKYCYNQIYNADPLVLYDLPSEIRAAGTSSIRYDFSTEKAAAVRSVLAGAVPRSMTRGHARNGIA